jgi:AcrR family transcriptional regulator
MSARLSNEKAALLLDEARRLIAEGGLGAVTHRSVEQAAGVPHGSVTYYFGSRDGLIAALVERMVTESEQQVAAIAARQAAGSGLDSIARTIATWMDANRELHLARLELELAAARDPRLRERMTDAARVFWRMCEPLAAAAGSDDPQRDGRAMTAMIDGLLLDRLAHPGQTHALLVEAVGRLTGPRPDAPRGGGGAGPRGAEPRGAVPRGAAPRSAPPGGGAPPRG